jgi:hypothetical protein
MRKKNVDEKIVEGRRSFRQWLSEDDGMGTVEIILIIVVLVGLVVLFKDQITGIAESLFRKITVQTGRI